MLMSMDFPNPSINSSHHHPNPNPNPNLNFTPPHIQQPFSDNITNIPPSSSCQFFVIPNDTLLTPSPFKGSHLGRDYSDDQLYNSADDIVINGTDIFNCSSSSSAFMDELGLVCDDDDPFSKYIDVSMIVENSDQEENIEGNNNNNNGNGCGSGGGGGGEEEEANGKKSRAAMNHIHHRHSFSLGDIEIVEPKKAMPPNKLAELWVSDPKRAKRILANRQSAARSKERKARYIAELEKKVQTLQKEAAALTTQLSIYQRDTTELTAENAELKLRLQTMEHQAQMRDGNYQSKFIDLNDALKREVDRLRFSTGEIRTTHAEPIKIVGVHPTSYNSSSTPPAIPHNVQLLPLFHTSPSTMAPCPLPENLHNIPLACIQGLDINNKGYFVKVENSTTSASTSENREYLVKVESSHSISASGNESSTAVC